MSLVRGVFNMNLAGFVFWEVFWRSVLSGLVLPECRNLVVECAKV